MRQNPNRRTVLGGLAASSLAGWLPATALAQADWPSRPLRIVVPSTAGSSLDGLARLYAEHLRVALKQTVVVENRPGANQTIGIAAVKSTPPDGYTLLLTSTELVRAPLLYPSVRYDAFTEFLPLSQIAATATFLAVPAALPVTGLREFIDYARKAAAPLTVGSPGQGSGAHYYSELLAQASGITLNHVAYRGEVPLVPDLIAGRVNAGWISGNLVTQFLAEGKIRVLGVGSVRRRAAAFPAVPTFSEQGVPGLDIPGFIGLFALAGTPAAIADRLDAELGRIVARPEVRSVIETYGFEAGGSSNRTQFEALMRSSHEGWVAAIRKANIKLE